MEIDLESRGLQLHCSRPNPKVALIDVSAPGYREFFFCVSGADTVSVTAFDPTDESWDQPRLYLLPRPTDWKDDASDEELLIQVWQLTGYPR